jgi:hypothetical protein
MTAQPAIQASVNIKTFNGTNSDQAKEVSRDSFTPDCNGGADHSRFVEFINGVFSIYDKNTGQLISRVSDQSFWQKAGIGDAANTVDPRIVCIPDAGQRGYGQWFTAQIEMSTRAQVYVACTNPQDSLPDPSLGKWKASAISLPGADFTQLGYDARGIYIGSQTAVEGGRAPQIIFIPREKALSWPPQVGPDDIKIFGPLPVSEYGSGLFPVIDGSGAGWPYQTFIGTDTITKSHLTYALLSLDQRVIVSHGTIPVAPFATTQIGNQVIQPTGERKVDYGGSISSAPYGDGFNIWVAQTVLARPSFDSNYGVRWYRLYIDPVTRIPGLAAWGELIDPKGRYDYFNPSIISLGKDDYTIISFSRSGDYGTPTDPNDPNCGNIGAYAAIINEKNAGSAPEIHTLQSGLANDYYPFIRRRWGDYCTICKDPDPKNPRKFWTTNEYVLAGGPVPASKWGTTIASLELGPIS